MEKLIPLISEIHDVLYQSNLSNQIHLPQIIVIGSQSTGKSSVLESIIGQDILPKGKGICTRSPIEIQLINKSKMEQEFQAEFLDLPGQKFDKTNEVIAQIEALTSKNAGEKKGITTKPIKLKIFSPHVIDLLLVDLPGMTKNPIQEQPKDIEKQILNMIQPYIENPNSLILAVSKANDDLANSEALKLARQVDPKGERTIGVITQLDIMDHGADILDDLYNKNYVLQMGYIGVVLRGEQNKKDGVTIQEQYKIEQKFFEEHQKYASHAGQMGMHYLKLKLNAAFVAHIKKCLPEIKESLTNLIQMKDFDLKQYGPCEVFESSEAKGLLILSLIQKYASSFSEMIRGQSKNKCQQEELFGGARINYIFFNIFKTMIEHLDPFEFTSDDEIRTSIRNTNGLRNTLFVPESAFENLVKQQIFRLQSPSLDCSMLVHEELKKLLYTINIPEIERYDSLRQQIFQVMDNLLESCLQPTQTMIKNLVEVELGFINTQHPDFIGGQTALLNYQMENGADQNENGNLQILKEDQIIKPNGKQIQQQNGKNQVNPNQPVQQNKQGGGGFFGNIFGGNNKQANDAQKVDDELEMMKSQKDAFQYQKVNGNGYNMELAQQELKQPRARGQELLQDKFGDFIPKTNLKQPPSCIKITGPLSGREKTEVALIKGLITSYFNVVKKNMADLVPKVVIHMLVNQVKKTCERELISMLYRPESFEKLLDENPFIVEQRRETNKMLTLLKNSLHLLNNIESRFSK